MLTGHLERVPSVADEDQQKLQKVVYWQDLNRLARSLLNYLTGEKGRQGAGGLEAQLLDDYLSYVEDVQHHLAPGRTFADIPEDSDDSRLYRRIRRVLEALERKQKE